MATTKQKRWTTSTSFVLRLFSFLITRFLLRRHFYRHICNGGGDASRNRLPIRLMQADGLAFPANSQIEHFHQNGKAHGEVNVSLRNMLVQSLDDQSKSDQEKETQCQHLDRGMALHKVRQRRGSKHHNCG